MLDNATLHVQLYSHIWRKMDLFTEISHSVLKLIRESHKPGRRSLPKGRWHVLMKRCYYLEAEKLNLHKACGGIPRWWLHSPHISFFYRYKQCRPAKTQIWLSEEQGQYFYTLQWRNEVPSLWASQIIFHVIFISLHPPCLWAIPSREWLLNLAKAKRKSTSMVRQHSF